MRFKYKARTKEGKLREGIIQASSKKAALLILEKYGLYATSLERLGKEGLLERKISFNRIPPKEVAFFTRQLSIMLKSGVPPVEALKSQIEQTKNRSFREKILKMAEAVEGGSSLSQAFSLFPKVFSQFYIGVVRSGEASGRVSESLNYLASHLEREYNLRHKMRGMMIYPAFVIVVFIAVFFLGTFFIIPRLENLIADFFFFLFARL